MSGDLWQQWQALFPFGPVEGDGGPPQTPLAPAAPGFAPFADSAGRFAAAYREYVAAAQPAAPRPDEALAAVDKAAQSFGNFLRDHFGEQFGRLFKLPGFPAAGMTPPPGSAFSDGPALGLGREQVLRAQRAAGAWSRLVQAQARLQRLWTDILRDAAAAFSSPLARASVEPVTTEAIDRMYDRWIDCAEEAYSRTAHSDEFCDALAEYVNAGSLWRREAAAGVEEAAKLADLPTRGEINTLALRLRELEAQLAALDNRPDNKAAPSAARPPNSSAVRKPGRPAKRRSSRPRRIP